jgi:hypothetical protein
MKERKRTQSARELLVGLLQLYFLQDLTPETQKPETPMYLQERVKWRMATTCSSSWRRRMQ